MVTKRLRTTVIEERRERESDGLRKQPIEKKLEHIWLVKKSNQSEVKKISVS